MEETLGAGWDGSLDQHDALVGLVAEELQGGEAAGRRYVQMLSAAGGYDEALVAFMLMFFRVTELSSIPAGVESRRLSRAATPSDPT